MGEELKLIERDQLWWDRFFLKLAEHFASASKDPSTQVGAVLVDDDGIVVGTGFNGFPRGVNDLMWRYHNREVKYKYVMHAEANAIVNSKGQAKGATLYVWPSFGLPSMCHDCAKIVIQAGVKEVVGNLPDPNRDFYRWEESLGIARQMCDEAGVVYRAVSMV